MLSGGNPLRGAVSVCTFVQQLLPILGAKAPTSTLSTALCPVHHFLTPPLCPFLLWKLLITWNLCDICNLRLFKGKKGM